MMPVTQVGEATEAGNVLVIGAGGFVGSAIVDALTRSGSLRPIAGVRRMEERGNGVEQRPVEATEPASLRAALKGTHYAVCSVLGAGRVMTETTRLLLELALESRLRKVVLLSSMSVYGSVEGLIDESAPLAGHELGSYGEAKVECESIAKSFIRKGLDISILRPGIVYGPGDDQWIGRFGRLLRSGRIGDLGNAGDGICNLIYKQDLGAAVREIIARPVSAGQAFNLCDGNSDTWNDFIAELARYIDVPHLPRISAGRLRAEAYTLAPPLQILKLAARRTARTSPKLPEPIPPSLLRLMGQRLLLDHRKAVRCLNLQFTPRTRGIMASAAWFLGRERQQGWLSGQSPPVTEEAGRV